MGRIFLVIVALIVAGCASEQQVMEQKLRVGRANIAYSESLKNAVVHYGTKNDCDKAFAYTKIFIQDHADMRINVSDDTIVSTFGATDYDRIAMRGTKEPGSGESCTIRLDVSCRGMFGPGDYFAVNCKERVSALNDFFRTTIEKKLGKPSQ